MDCLKAREALSARMDCEDLPPGVEDATLDGHVSACSGCQQWLADVEGLGRAWRIGSAPAVSHMVDRVLDTSLAGGGRLSRSEGVEVVLRGALVVVGVLQLALTIPVLALGHDRESPAHVAHEMGSFGVAVTVGVIAAAMRPRLARGVMWLMGAAAAALAVTALIDLMSGATTLADEAPHLLVVAAAALLWVLSRQNPDDAGDRRLLDPRRAGGPPLSHPTGGLRLLRRSRPGLSLHPALAGRKRKAA